MSVTCAVPDQMEREYTDEDPRVDVIVPEDSRRKEVIDLLAKFVATDGEAFEQVRLHIYDLIGTVECIGSRREATTT